MGLKIDTSSLKYVQSVALPYICNGLGNLHENKWGTTDGGDGQEVMVAMKNVMMRSGSTMVVCSMLAQVGLSYAATVLRVPAATGLTMEIAPRWVYQETLSTSITSVLGYILLLQARRPLLLLVSTMLLRPRQSSTPAVMSSSTIRPSLKARYRRSLQQCYWHHEGKIHRRRTLDTRTEGLAFYGLR